MTNLSIRESPSGPATSLSDTRCPPATVLGRPLTAIGEGLAEPLDGTELGAVTRLSGYHAITLTAGSYDTISIPDDTRVVDITPIGPVTITGFQMSNRSNRGAFLIVRKRGASASGSITFPFNGATPNPQNAIWTPGINVYVLQNEFDSAKFARFAGNQRWQVLSRLPRPSALSPSDFGLLGLPFLIRSTFTAGGAPADDVTISASLPFNLLLYDAIQQVSSAVAASTTQVRTLAGGGGSAVTSLFDTATTGSRRDNDIQAYTLAQGSALFLRRSTGAIAGTILLWAKRIP